MSDSDDILPKGVNKIMKDIVAKRYACPICKKVYKDDAAAYQCRNRCASIIFEESSVKEPRYVTPCGCVFSTPGIAKEHIMVQKDCCGYFKNETEEGTEYYYIAHAESESNINYCRGSGILFNHKNVKISDYLEIAGYYYSLFVRTKRSKKSYFRLQQNAKKITSDEFDQGLKDCIDSIKESIKQEFSSKKDGGQ